MRFTRDPVANVNVIRSYGPEGVRINDITHRTSLIVAASSLRPEPQLRHVEELTAEHIARILELQPELVLLGTGERQVFPAPAFGAGFLQAGVGFEVMDTGAACRTFNVLVGELRQVVALLLL